MQDVGELALDHQQTLVEDGFNLSLSLLEAIMDQVHQTLTR